MKRFTERGGLSKINSLQCGLGLIQENIRAAGCAWNVANFFVNAMPLVSGSLMCAIAHKWTSLTEMPQKAVEWVGNLGGRQSIVFGASSQN